jgi:hypothetical protein
MGSGARTSWRAIVVAIAAASLLGSGCGGEDESAAGSDREQIEAVLGDLREAQESGDAELACSDVYVVREPERPGGEAEGAGEEGDVEAEGEEGAGECEEAFERADAARREEVADLATEVSSVKVDGDAATAVVHTTLVREDGSKLVQDVPYDLVLTEDGWRVRIAEEG